MPIYPIKSTGAISSVGKVNDSALVWEFNKVTVDPNLTRIYMSAKLDKTSQVNSYYKIGYWAL